MPVHLLITSDIFFARAMIVRIGGFPIASGSGPVKRIVSVTLIPT